MSSIRTIVMDYIASDDSYSSKADCNIKYMYENSLDKVKLDNIFIELCGYSLETILSEVGHD